MPGLNYLRVQVLGLLVNFLSLTEVNINNLYGINFTE